MQPALTDSIKTWYGSTRYENGKPWRFLRSPSPENNLVFSAYSTRLSPSLPTIAIFDQFEFFTKEGFSSVDEKVDEDKALNGQRLFFLF